MIHLFLYPYSLHFPSRLSLFACAVDPLEAERLVESLKMFEIEEIGCSAWLQQHEVLERLNIQAHQSAASNSDEYVLESIMT